MDTGVWAQVLSALGGVVVLALVTLGPKLVKYGSDWLEAHDPKTAPTAPTTPT